MSKPETNPLIDWGVWLLASIIGIIGGAFVGWILGAVFGAIIAWPLGRIITIVGATILSLIIAGIGAITGMFIGLRLAWVLYPKSDQ